MLNAVTKLKEYKKEIIYIFLIIFSYLFIQKVSFNINILMTVLKKIEKIQILCIFIITISILCILLKKKLKNKIINMKNIIIFMIPLTIFIILFYAYYPGIITYDGNFQWQQVQSGIIETGHPFLTTLFLLILSKIYNSTSLIIFYQIFLFSLIWTFFCNNSRNSKKDFIIQVIYTLILSLIPIISIYSITLWKDILYTYYLIGLTVIIYVGIKKKFNYSKLECFILYLLLFMIFNYRYNGIIVVILFVLFMLIYKRKNKIFIKKFSIVLLVLFLSIFLFNQFQNQYLNKNSKQDNAQAELSTIDGYIFWMFGAHLQDGNIKEKKDIEFLSNIADINEWKNKYNPYLINHTNMMNKNSIYINKYNKKFKKIFIETTINHPQTIIIHYLKSDALLWSPFNQGYVYIYDFSKWSSPFGFDGKIISRIPKIEEQYTKIINLTFKEPINIIFHRPANLMYISIILAIIIALIEKSKKIFLILLPMILNTISLLPINLAQDLRYVYINYLTLAVIMLLFIQCLFNLKRSKKNEKNINNHTSI